MKLSTDFFIDWHSATTATQLGELELVESEPMVLPGGSCSCIGSCCCSCGAITPTQSVHDECKTRRLG